MSADVTAWLSPAALGIVCAIALFAWIRTDGAAKAIWTPKWQWTVAISLGVLAVVLLFASFGWGDPIEVLSVVIGGALGAFLAGGLAAVIGSFIKLPSGQRSVLVRVFAVAGVMAGTLLERAVTEALTYILPGPTLGGFIVGASLGALCGLLPLQRSRPPNRNFGAVVFWFCTIGGGLGGLAFALPCSLVSTAFARFRSA